ncbi:site-2 protease family protein [Roseimaritima sediminicola]|uniref:site-2 protease family protein n=1 Tax=Roseimaritima sediminicola TaxID=2662066 RepID=UPI0012983342|nr:site-2 protease family protein [Roseimaritima sediminicola]
MSGSAFFKPPTPETDPAFGDPALSDPALNDPALDDPALGDPAADAAPVRLRDGLHFRSQPSAGRPAYVCHDTQRGKYYHFGVAELEIARLLDGRRSIEQLAAELQQLGVIWTAEDIAIFLSSLVKNGLAEVVREDGETGGVSPEGPPPTPMLPRMLAGLVSQRIPLFAADRAAVRLTAWLHRLFSPLGVVLWSLLVLSGLWQAARHRGEWQGELHQLFSPHAWPLLVGIWLIAKVIHESGHAVAARRQGVRVGNAGVILFMFAPLAYVDVTDAWRLPRRWARMQIALAGVYFELAIAAIAVWVWMLSSDLTLRYVAAQVAVLTGPATLLVNANPLLRLDGYYVLADFLGIPNLRMHGRRMFSGKCQAWLLGREPQPSLLHGWQRTTAFWHAVLSVLFQVIWMSSMVWGILFWAGAIGLVIGAAAVLLWVVLPLQRWIAGLRELPEWPQYRRRLRVVSGGIVMLLVLLACLPSPLGRRIPVVVRYQDEQVARAASDGFVVDVPVRSGDRVRVGEVLVEMDDPSLRARLASLDLDIQATRVRHRKLQNQGEQAMATAQAEQLASLRRQRAEVQRQVDALTVRATRGGRVITPRLQTLRGTYLHQGDEVVRVAEERDKELLAAIDGGDLQGYRQAVESGRSLTARLRGGMTLEVIPSPPAPRASLSVPHPALAASSGGPLALAAPLETERGGERTLVSPHTEAVSPLSPEAAATLRTGQQGMLIIGDTRSLVQRIYQRLWASVRR